MDLKRLGNVPPYDWPEDTDEAILDTLTSKQASASDRLTAARMAGEIVVMNNEIAETLLALAQSSHEPEDLRATAAVALGAVLEQADVEMLGDGKFDDPNAVPITEATFRQLVDGLRKLYSDESLSKEVRRRVLEASVRAQRDWHATALKTAYGSKDKDWKLTAVFGMQYIRGFDAQILESLESSDRQLRYFAIEAAGNWQIDAAWPHIVGLVQDPRTPKDLRLAAIEALANIRPEEAGTILVDIDHRGDEEIKEAADEAMMMAAAQSEEPDEEDNEDEDDDESDDEEGENGGKWLN